MSETTEIKGQFGHGQSGGTGKKLKIYIFLQMSDYIPPKYSKRQLDLQNVNTYVNVHDCSCRCKSPLKHIIQQILHQEPTLKPWLATTIADAGNHDGEKDIDGFGPGELEALFAEGEDTKDG